MWLKKSLIILTILGIFTACTNENKENEQNDTNTQASFSQGNKLNFALKILNDKDIFVNSDEGKISFMDQDKATLLVFFTTWCAPCIAEIPHLNKLQEKYKEDFNVIAVLLEDKNNEELLSFAKENKISYKIANGENNYLLAKIIGGVNGIPTMLLYSKDGNLINQYLGVIAGEMLEIEIQKAII